MTPDFSKYADGLVPAIIQDSTTDTVLMLGFMNAEALELTERSGRVVFYSRSRKTLWKKGESSGNYLNVRSIAADCDNDTLLIKATPEGPVCHTGAATCFGPKNEMPTDLLLNIEAVISERRTEQAEGSYVASIFKKGINKIAQKVGEEAVELVIEAKDNDDKKFVGEAADLLFHYLILLNAKGFSMSDVIEELAERRK